MCNSKRTGLGIPPVRHFPDNRPTEEFHAAITGVIILVEDEVEITTGTVDVVHQEVGGEYISIGAPLCEQLGEKYRRKGVANTSTEGIGIEFFAQQCNAVKFDKRFYTDFGSRPGSRIY